ncbi:MAG: ATP-binding protein [Actinomycetota bacterium]
MITRSSNDRVLTGVAGGIGERLGLDPIVVRLAFVVLAFAGGVGVFAYVAFALVSRAPDPEAAPSEPPRTSPRQALSVVLVVAGVLLLCRELGLWFGDGVVGPAALAVIGSALIWSQGGGAHRARWLPRVDVLAGRGSRLRVLVGALVVLVGVWLFITTNRPVELLGNAPLAVAAVLIGLAVVAGPWVWRLVRQVTVERRERIRQEERAEMAAHLHDSVLQTLALIQRTDDADEMASLARVQERELRTWLYGKTPAGGADSLSGALDQVAGEIERTHRRRVEVVLVGDCELDDGVRALVHACREAMVNAARHSGARGVSVYLEVEDDQVTAFVRDQGIGFSKSGVPADRRGIAESIEGRMERNGGVALVESEPGRGTEVRLRIPRGRA